MSEVPVSGSAEPEATPPPSARPARSAADGSPGVSEGGGSTVVSVGGEERTTVDASAFGDDHTVVDGGSFVGAAPAVDDGAALVGGGVTSDWARQGR